MRSPPQSGSFGKNTRHARANSFQTQNNSDIPKESAPRPKSGYEYFQEKSQGFPGMSRANTMRVPKKAGFAPGTPGGDEPAAKNTSSYFNSRAERAPPRPQTHYPPPPPPPVPTPNSRRPIPLRSDATRPAPPRVDPVDTASPRHDPQYPKIPRSFTSPRGQEDLFGSIDRLSTPYATSGGERTYFSSAGLHRSSSSHSNSDRNGWPKGYTPTNGSPLSPPGPNRHHSASPKIRSPNPRRESFSSSSLSSSEDEGPLSNMSRSRSSARRASADHRSSNQGPNNGYRRPPYPSVRVEDGNKSKADSAQPKHSSTWTPQPNAANQMPPKQYSASQPNSRKGSAGSDQEGFFQHRAKWATDRGQQLPKSPLRATAPWNTETFEKPLEKSKSWHENFGSKEEGNNQRRFDPPSSGQSKEAPPMYDSSIDNFPTFPSTFNGLHQTLSSSPRLKLCSSFWPYWAVPSSITPRKRLGSGSSSFCLSEDTPFGTYYDANTDSLNSFQFPDNYSGTTSPRKAQSSESINTTFSPTGWHGKFNGDAEDYLGAKGNGVTPRGRSPPKGRPTVHTPFRERVRPTASKENMPPYDSMMMPPPPPMPPLPPKSPEKVPFSEEQWRETFKDPNWVYPGPPPVPSPRAGNTKRPKQPRKLSTANKRPTVPKPAHISATVDREDEGDASNEASSVLESEASNSSSGNAMDIDPALTPPSATPQFSQSTSHSQTYTDPITRIIRSAVPRQPQMNGDTDQDASRLNLSELKTAAPFAPSQGGLKDLDDLKSTLPFPSAPSAIPGQSSAPQQLALPAPPKPPNVPETITQSTFDQYMAYMHAYMAEWSMYNTKMLTHFNTRQNEVENELGNDWMSSVGTQGYIKYMRGVEEDFRVRNHWDVCWEKHRDCMRALGRVRDKAIKVNCSA